MFDYGGVFGLLRMKLYRPVARAESIINLTRVASGLLEGTSLRLHGLSPFSISKI